MLPILRVELLADRLELLAFERFDDDSTPASKSSRKHFTAEGSRCSYSSTTTSLSIRATSRDGAWQAAFAFSRNSGHSPSGTFDSRLRIRWARQRARRAWEALFHRTDQPRSAVRRHQQRIDQAAPLEILEEGPAALGVFLRSGREMQQHLLALDRDPPRAQHGLAALASVSSLAGSRGSVAIQSRIEPGAAIRTALCRPWLVHAGR